MYLYNGIISIIERTLNILNIHFFVKSNLLNIGMIKTYYLFKSNDIFIFMFDSNHFFFRLLKEKNNNNNKINNIIP